LPIVRALTWKSTAGRGTGSAMALAVPRIAAIPSEKTKPEVSEYRICKLPLPAA
jgi:hypothetical protein